MHETLWQKACRAQPYLIQVWQGFLEPHEFLMEVTAELVQQLEAVQILTEMAPALSRIASAPHGSQYSMEVSITKDCCRRGAHCQTLLKWGCILYSVCSTLQDVSV